MAMMSTSEVMHSRRMRTIRRGHCCGRVNERVDTLARTESELVHCIKSDKLCYFVHMMMREPFDKSESSVMTGFVKHGQPTTIS